LAAQPPSRAGATAGNRPFWRWALAGLLIVVIGAAAWQVNVRPLTADIAARSARRHTQRGDGPRSIAAAERAVAHWPAEPAHQLLLGRSYWGQAVADPQAARRWLPSAEVAVLAARRIRPDDPAVWLHVAQFYTSAARQFGADTRGLAERAYRQAVELAPNHAAIHAAWGRTYLEDDDPGSAAPLLRRAVQLDASNGQTFLYLGAAELAVGRLEVALAAYHEAVRLVPDSGPAYAGIATCYWLLERPQEALLAVENALQRDPQNAQAIAVRQAIHRAS
jgi:tetratricopeptide (TPR) repeat protein